jgi:hypothetical protein
LNKNYFIILSGVVSICLISASIPEKSSSGAPASHTGAPGEKTCAVSGCHDDNAINSGSASLLIDFGKQNEYKLGNTYQIRIVVKDDNKYRFGFQLLALNSSDNSNAGKFVIADKERTQITKNQYELKDREYITYTYNGTDAVEDGKGEWLVNWTAPSINTGNIILYASAVSANDNENDKGDYVYTTQLEITPIELNFPINEEK